MVSPVLSIYQNNLNLFHPSCLFLTLHGPSLLFFPSGESFYVVSFDVNVLSFIVIRLITTQEKSANQAVHLTPTPCAFHEVLWQTVSSSLNRGQACDFGSLSSNFPFDLFDTVLKIRRLSHFLSQLIDSGTDRRIISIELVCSLSDRC